jgi:RNA polymerase sigma-70 factor (ECF subfamily)
MRGEARDERVDFEAAVLVHLGAAYNLARWLVRDEQNAKDIVQDAYLKALRSFDGFRGGDGRAWLLTIVRNTCYTWLRKTPPGDVTVSFDEEFHGHDDDTASGPEAAMLRNAGAESLRRALEQVPVELREAFVLRELEGLSYAEIAAVAQIPVGTVMSRLSRTRERLRQSLRPGNGKDL